MRDAALTVPLVVTLTQSVGEVVGEEVSFAGVEEGVAQAVGVRVCEIEGALEVEAQEEALELACPVWVVVPHADTAPLNVAVPPGAPPLGVEVAVVKGVGEKVACGGEPEGVSEGEPDAEGGGEGEAGGEGVKDCRELAVGAACVAEGEVVPTDAFAVGLGEKDPARDAAVLAVTEAVPLLAIKKDGEVVALGVGVLPAKPAEVPLGVEVGAAGVEDMLGEREREDVCVCEAETVEVLLGEPFTPAVPVGCTGEGEKREDTLPPIPPEGVAGPLPRAVGVPGAVPLAAPHSPVTESVGVRDAERL